MAAKVSDPPGSSLFEILGEVSDPRNPSGRRFPLQGILCITVAAMLCGRQGLASIARWGRECGAEQLRRLGIERAKAPCHATYHNVFKALSTEAVEASLGKWVRVRLPPGASIAIDGKTVRGSRYDEYPALHLLAAYCDVISGVVGQVSVTADKTNEAKAAAMLLKRLPIRGHLITGDAMFAQREVCQTVLDGGGDYLVTVKGNQPALQENIDQGFAPSLSPLRRNKAAGERKRGSQPGKKAWQN